MDRVGEGRFQKTWNCGPSKLHSKYNESRIQDICERIFKETSVPEVTEAENGTFKDETTSIQQPEVARLSEFKKHSTENKTNDMSDKNQDGELQSQLQGFLW